MAKKKKAADKEKSFLTVALGASAGGIKALAEFFSGMPADSGMAFVVILHLSQTHKSNLAEILQRQTEMNVIQVKKTVSVKPDQVYVIPPAKHLEMTDGIIKLKEPERIKGVRVPIDRFFRTMADAYGRKAVCIILSGTGSDGTMGMKHVKGQGGFAIIQDPQEADYEGMPRSAIETKIADVVLPVAKMPEKLLFVRDTTEKWRLTDGDDSTVASGIKHMELLRDVLTLLRVRTGHDFSNYKRPTLIRRLARHLQIYETDDLKEYLNILRSKPEEVLSLLKNLLINVTNFFRDKEAFEVLQEKVIPELFKGKKVTDQVRVWIAGCSTGEEAYSIAILLSEYATTLPESPNIQVFASDVDEDAISEAREGRFTDAIVSDISPERLQKFFIKEEDNAYRIRKGIREMILFAPHNILRDPPFSRLDMVSCRNVLIYLNRKTQEQVLNIFHFALHENGYLFLGSSETTDSTPRHFSPFDKKHRLYQCRPSNASWKMPPPLPLPGVWMPQRRELPTEMRGNLQSFGELHHRLIEYYAPPSILINEEGDILHLSESAGQYLRFAGGEPSANITKAIHPALLSDVRAALFSARKENKTVEAKNIRVQINGQERSINITVRPVGTSEASALIMFEEIAGDLPSAESMQAIIAGDKAMETVIRRMEDELRHTKDRLRNTIEQYETSTEELKASNEELQAINEELRSTAEELETSKEELQSVNEELTTVNNELKDKVEEVSQANSDLENLMRSTDIATIFLDKELNIKRYTPSATGVFNLIPGDIGRPLSHVTHQLSPDDFQKDAAKVLQSLHSLKREVQSKDGRAFIVRFSPYRTIEDKIDGVVLTFVDITETKRTGEALLKSQEKYRTLFEAIDQGFCIVEVLFDEKDKAYDFRFLEVNKAFEKQTGLKQAVGKTIKEMIPGHEPYWFDVYGKIIKTGEPESFENEAVDFGRYYEVYAFRIGPPQAHRLAILFNDISERKDAEKRQEYILRLSDKLNTLSNAVGIQKAAIGILGAQLEVDRAFYAGVAADKKHWVITDNYVREGAAPLTGSGRIDDFGWAGEALRSGKTVCIADARSDHRLSQAAREAFRAVDAVAILAIPLIKDEQWAATLSLHHSSPRTWSEVEIKLTEDTAERTWAAVERAKAEEALLKSEERLRLATLAAKMGTFVYDPNQEMVEPDKEMRELLNLQQTTTLSMTTLIDEFIYPKDRERLQAEVKQALDPAGNGRLHVDLRIVSPKDTIYWVNITAKTTFSAAHLEALLMRGVAIDITDRKRMEKALRESEENYRVMINQAIAGILKLDMKRQFIFVNDQMSKMLGYSKEELLKMNLNAVIHEKDLEQDKLLFNRLKTEGKAYTMEKRMICRDGHYIWVYNQISPLLNEEGKPASALIISVDISKQKAIEKQKDDFIGIASHELKTPLTSIKAYAELLQEMLLAEENSESVLLVKNLNKQAQRLSRLIYGLLDTTRISEGRFDLQYEEFDLNKLIEDCASEAKLTAPNYQISVQPGEIQPVFADPDRIGQVLTNLISNAIKYSPKADQVIITSEDVKGEQAKVSVRDFGVGLKPGLKDKIFKRFYRSLDIGNPSGFGLGLYISKEIIKLHSGEMGVESPGTGSVFYFMIPYKPG